MSEYKVSLSWVMAKRTGAAAVAAITSLFLSAVLSQPILRFILRNSLSSNNYLYFRDSMFLIGIIWMAIAWSAAIVYGHQSFVHYLNVHPFYLRSCLIMLWICTLSVQLTTGYLLSQASDSSNYDISSLLLLCAVSSATAIHHYIRRQSTSKVQNHNFYIQLPVVPLSIPYSVRNEIVSVIFNSLKVVPRSVLRSFCLQTMLISLLTGRLDINMSLLSRLLSTTIISFLSLWTMCPLVSVMSIILNYPIDFTKINFNGLDYVFEAICSGIFKPINRVSLPLSTSASTQLAIPYWHQIQLAHREFIDKTMTSANTKSFGRPCLSALSNLQPSNWLDIYLKRFVYQDLARLMRGSSSRRAKVYMEKKFYETNFALCSFIDTVTLQVPVSMFMTSNSSLIIDHL
jgi:hypothetical protein